MLYFFILKYVFTTIMYDTSIGLPIRVLVETVAVY